MRRLIVALIAVSVLALSACANDASSGGASPGGDLTGVTWVLDRASMQTLTAGDVPTDARIDIAFEGTEVAGHAACNSYFGGFEADAADGTLSISQLGSTQMACEEPLMSMESAYLAALGDVTGYQVTGDQQGLVLTGGKAALTYQPDQPAEALPLEGTTWTLTTIAKPSTHAVSSTIAGTEVTLTLADGNASGSGGCNTYNGTYQTGTDGSLAFGPIASTKKMCEQDVSNQEQAYVAALQAVASSGIEGDQLTLSDGSGQMLLQFTGVAAGM